jgi:uncharacterized RDD family membrane protein YckC
VVVVLFASVFLGFDEIAARHRANLPDARLEYIRARNGIRALVLTVYLLYCLLLEASPLRATLGKWLLGMEVVDVDGRPLTLRRSLARSAGKLGSFAPLGLGCLRVAWSADRRAWHDLIAGTRVILRTRRKDSADSQDWWNRES